MCKQELRTCYVNDKKAKFHDWCNGDVRPTAIVEFEDGSVDTCYMNEIRFDDVYDCDNSNLYIERYYKACTSIESENTLTPVKADEILQRNGKKYKVIFSDCNIVVMAKIHIVSSDRSGEIHYENIDYDEIEVTRNVWKYDPDFQRRTLGGYGFERL